MIMPKASEIGKVRATPAARKLARERGINLEKISGSGENGRIHKEDVEQFSKIRVTPLARRIAKDRGVDLEKLVGTGVSGKITKEDVLASLGETVAQKEGKGSQVSHQPVAVSDTSLASDGVEIVKMSAMRKAISKGM
ncbi:E3 binding domain-containing protein, partial [Streptococcus sp.]|uniref:E3 binding domain-containing protein n=1 Tax=Streptococcus sp. TaxID=1306 RepID=UPI0034C671FB